MPYVASIGTYVSCSFGLSPEVRGFVTGIDAIGYEGLGFPRGRGGRKLVEAEVATVGGGERDGAQISLVHNVFRSTAASAMTIPEGATHGA